MTIITQTSNNTNSTEQEAATSSVTLAQINQKILAEGESLPLVKLSDGSTVQTGTFATLIHNIKLYDQTQNPKLVEEIQAALPTLAKIGLFELFPAACWRDSHSAGKRLVAELLPDEKVS